MLTRSLSRKSIELTTGNGMGDLDLRNYSEHGLTLEQNLRGGRPRRLFLG
jgi:hypothetical protein